MRGHLCCAIVCRSLAPVISPHCFALWTARFSPVAILVQDAQAPSAPVGQRRARQHRARSRGGRSRPRLGARAESQARRVWAVGLRAQRRHSALLAALPTEYAQSQGGRWRSSCCSLGDLRNTICPTQSNFPLSAQTGASPANCARLRYLAEQSEATHSIIGWLSFSMVRGARCNYAHSEPDRLFVAMFLPGARRDLATRHEHCASTSHSYLDPPRRRKSEDY